MIINMVFINILGDGVTIPVLRDADLLVTLKNGDIEAGKYNREIFCNSDNGYLITPNNKEELMEALKLFIYNTLPDLIFKKHTVYFLCPKEIATKAIWE